MLLLLLGALLVNNFLYETEAKVYTKCGLAQELVRLGVDKTFVGNWVCLIEAESGRDTSKQIAKANGGKGLGLFQINSKDWCAFGKAGGKCNAKCEDFLDEELTKDIACAKKIESSLGFRNWEGWTRSCYNRDYPSTIISICFPSAG